VFAIHCWCGWRWHIFAKYECCFSRVCLSRNPITREYERKYKEEHLDIEMMVSLMQHWREERQTTPLRKTSWSAPCPILHHLVRRTCPILHHLKLNCVGALCWCIIFRTPFLGALIIMVVSISIHILVSYDFMILPWSIDMYHDGILIWVVSYSYLDTYRGIFSIPIQKRYNTIPHLW
jgi:hypothetical protein